MINVKDHPYLAVGDGMVDNYNAIQSALDDAATNEEVYIPAGTYMVSQRIVISSRKMRGEHFWRPNEKGTIIKAAPNFPHDEVIYSANSPCQLLDLFIDANNVCNYGLHAIKSHGGTTLFSNLSVDNANASGFYFDRCQSTTVERIVAKSNVIGITALDCNGTRFVHCLPRYNSSHGMVAKRNNASAGCRINNLISEHNDGDGLHVDGVVGIIIQNCWLEGNHGDGVRLERCRNAIVEACRITGGDSATDRCVRLSQSKMCRVFNCTAAQKGFVDYLKIRDESGVANEIDKHNARLSELVVERLPVERV